MLRRAAQLAAAAAAVAACNALTGVGDLSESAATFDAGFDAPAPLPTTTATTTTAPPPPPPPPSDAGADADADADATPDTGAPDTYVPPPPCVNGSSGPRYGVDATSTDLVGEKWGFPEGARVPSDSAVAHSNGTNPNTLTVGAFGFAIPKGATIEGIKVELHRTAFGTVTDSAIGLLKGTTKANGAWPPGSESGPFIVGTYGGPTDLWGTTFSPGDINESSFAVNVKVSGDGDGHLDAIGVTVYFCAPP